MSTNLFQFANPILKFLLQWFDQSSSEHDGLLIEQLACIVISRYFSSIPLRLFC